MKEKSRLQEINSSNVEIRQFSERDITRAAELFSQAFGPDELGEPWTFETAKRHIEETCESKYSLVAVDKGEVVGVALAFEETFEDGPEVYLDALLVETSRRGQNIGIKLHNELVEIARRNTLRAIRLVAHPHLPSFNWYDRLGYTNTGWIEKKLKV